MRPIERLEKLLNDHNITLSKFATSNGLSSGHFYAYKKPDRNLGSIQYRLLQRNGINPEYIKTGEGEPYLGFESGASTNNIKEDADLSLAAFGLLTKLRNGDSPPESPETYPYILELWDKGYLMLNIRGNG